MSRVGFRRLDRDSIVRRLRAYAREELARRPEVQRVVLIGSLARGDWSARSDADVVVVVTSASERGPVRGSGYLPSTSVGAPVDVLVYTEDEAADWSPRFAADVQRGIELYDRNAP
jgi:predicted nucleotidyltransferase